MKENDVGQFQVMIETLGELYAKPMSPTLLELYWCSCQRFELDDIRTALKAHVNDAEHGTFFPKPADIVRHIEGTNEDKGLIAWSKVEGAISSAGRYESVAFDDGLIHAVLTDLGGWVKCCELDCKQLPYFANEFVKRYQRYVIKPPVGYPAYLTGMLTNGLEPKRIGDKSLVGEVMRRAGECDLKTLLDLTTGGINEGVHTT